MTDIDLNRLRRIADARSQPRFHAHTERCLYENPWCTITALLDRLEAAERERDVWYSAHRTQTAETYRLIGERDKLQAQRDQLAEALREVISDVEEAIDQIPSLKTIGEAEKAARKDFLNAKLHRYQSALAAVEKESSDE